MSLHLDFESRSHLPLGGKTSVGVYNYATSELTEILMLAWAYDDEPVEIWEPRLGDMPARLRQGLEDSKQQLSAFNSTFERYLLNFKLGLNVAIERFEDPQVGGRYLSLPGDLDSVSEILGLPKELAKDKRGEALIKFFCEPQKRKKKGQPEEKYWNDWQTHPVEWEVFKEYCKQDVRAERECARRMRLLQALPLPSEEHRLWVYDQRWNDRGVPVDVPFVKSAYKLAVRSKQESLDSQNKLTGLENANSRDQLLPWVKERGYPFNTLRKDTVQAVLKNPEYNLTEECRQVLTARLEAGSTTYQKLAKVMAQVSEDGRLRNQFIFMGSARCGRWSSSGGAQLHNMARPSPEFEKMENLIAAREMIYGEKYDEIVTRFKSVLLTVKNCIRTIFVAPNGERLEVADLNAIETRVAAWLSGCQSLLKVFEPLPDRPNGRDPYLDFAVKMTGLPYEKLDADLHSKDETIKSTAKRHRQIAKPGVLGAVYRLGGGGWGFSKDSGYIDPETGEKVYDKIKTGLFGYADAMGVSMELKQAHEVVRIFRDSYPEIPQFWYQLEEAVADVLNPKAVNTIRKVGPNGCITFDKINITGRFPLLRMQLPSGRFLHYFDARIENTIMPWKNSETGEDVYKPTLVYAGMNQKTKQWENYTTSHGGKLLENGTQAVARDVLAVKLMLFEENDLPVVLHAHDEGGCQVLDDAFSSDYRQMEEIMSRPISWAPGLLLGAEGFSSKFYHK